MIKLSNIPLNEDCGCNGPQLIKESKSLVLSEGMKYHIKEGRMLIHNIYRPLSENYFALVNEARNLYNQGLLSVTEDDAELLESDLGKFGIYRGIKVPLDYPILLEELIQLTEELEEASEKKHPPLGKPHRGGSKKFYVYVRKPGGGVLKKYQVLKKENNLFQIHKKQK